MRQVLRDKLGNRIGEIEVVANRQILRDKLGNRLGEYDARMNVTRDKLGNRVGSGNLLLLLLNSR